MTLPHFQPHPFLLPPPRINLCSKTSIFPSSPLFLHFNDFSGGRKLHSLYCFLPGVLWIPHLRKCHPSAGPFALWFSPTPCGLWYCCQGGCKLRQSSGLGRAEAATTAMAGTITCSHLVMVRVQGQLKNMAWHCILFPEPQDNSVWCHLVSQSLPAKELKYHPK